MSITLPGLYSSEIYSFLALLQAPERDAKLDMHFVAFVCVDGHLYEMDGRKKFPINHGESSPETLLQVGGKGAAFVSRVLCVQILRHPFMH